jgi:hypothetical protein
LRRIVLTSIVALQLTVTVARADETEEAAQLHLDRGVEAFRAREYARAHREFAIAHELAPDRANPYRWLALTEVQLGDCPAALGHIDEFVARVKPDDERLAELIRLRVMCERADHPEPSPAAVPRRAPITRRWWFWTALAGGVAVIAGTIAVVASSDDGEATTLLPPIHCGDDGCAP